MLLLFINSLDTLELQRLYLFFLHCPEHLFLAGAILRRLGLDVAVQRDYLEARLANLSIPRALLNPQYSPDPRIGVGRSAKRRTALRHRIVNRRYVPLSFGRCWHAFVLLRH